jgi:hypothetical protein
MTVSNQLLQPTNPAERVENSDLTGVVATNWFNLAKSTR